MEYFTFKCGCKFPVIGTNQDGSLKVSFNPDVEELNLYCERTWDYLCEGNTKGIFQLESQLGQSLAKKQQPRSIEELAALISTMRPGCTESKLDGKTLTNHFIDRKHGREPVTYLHPVLEPILKDSYGILIYQEQAMQIAQVVAGFNLKEADTLRKAIGKKKPEEMAKVKKLFLENSAKLNIVSKEEADEIFGWIEASQRYSFNKSHAVCYAYDGYLSAFTKAHFTRPFFTSYLHFAKEKIKPLVEVNELINNTRRMDIDVSLPDLRRLNKHFALRDKIIYFGLVDVKGIGESVLVKIKNNITEVEQILGKTFDKWSWLEFLLFYSTTIPTSAMIPLASVGALAYMDVPRTKMLFEHGIISKLSDRELKWCQDYYKLSSKPIYSFEEILQNAVNTPTGKEGAVANKRRLQTVTGLLESLKNPPYSLTDNPEWIAGIEQSLLGISITCTKVDGCDTTSANCTCKDFINGKKGYSLIAVQVDNVREITTKNGKNPGAKMAFVSVSDSTCALDSVVAFSDVWKEFKGLLIPGNTVIIAGEKGKGGDGFQLKKVYQI